MLAAAVNCQAEDAPQRAGLCASLCISGSASIRKEVSLAMGHGAGPPPVLCREGSLHP